jgi:TonB-linked SusC/RagA family outer membrane protein
MPSGRACRHRARGPRLACVRFLLRCCTAWRPVSAGHRRIFPSRKEVQPTQCRVSVIERPSTTAENPNAGAVAPGVAKETIIMKSFVRSLAVLLAAVGIPAAAGAQANGVVTGRVIDQTTQQPLTDVQVVIVGTTRGGLTNAQGTYRIEALAPGTYTVRATRIGYDGEDQRVTLAAGATATANFSLAPAAVSLDAVVVTATGTQKKRELANAVSQVNADQVVGQAPITTVSQLLTGRAAGVNIVQSSGAAGTNSRIRIRGSTSVSLSNNPIVFVDGVRLYNNDNGFSVGVGGQETSPLSTLNPEEIESVEVIKGPSAATLYGTDAANGVIRIITKKGSAGTPRWNVYVEQGRINDVVEYPLNFRGRTSANQNCFAFQVGLGDCQQAALLSFQPLNDPEVSPFGDGSRAQYGVSVSGGGDAINYFFSGEYEDEVGIYELPDSARRAILETTGSINEQRERPNRFERVSLRANVGAQVAEGLRLTVASGFSNTETRLPQNDNNALGILPSGLLGGFEKDARFGFGFLLPSEIFAIAAEQNLDRFTGSANLQWTPTQAEWFTGRATLGLDNTSRHDESFTPVGEVPLGRSILGRRTSNRIDISAVTGDLGGTANFQVTPSISSRSSAGVQYYREFFQGTFAFGEELGPGTRTVSSAADQFANEATTESITLGTFVEQQFGWNDRLFVTGALRADDNSAFGQEFDLITYPKFGASYVVIDEQDEPFFNVVNSLRLRTAWGAAGRAPGATDAVRFFEPITATVGGRDVPAVAFDRAEGLGNRELRPERSEEIEVGFDAGFLDGRLGLELTYYNKNTTDALINRRLAPSLGVPVQRFENLGEVRNSGWEMALNADLLRLPNAAWTLNLTGSTNDNELIELGEGIEPILFGSQRFQEGFPLGAFFEKEVTFADANGNGIIEPSEVTVADTATFIGSALPTREFSIANTVTLFNVLRISGLLDYRGGFFQHNFTEEFRCRFRICRGLNDPEAPLFEQARAVQTVTRGGGRSSAPFIEDADFWKLRELSFTLMVPNAWAGRIGASKANLVLSGRNLATWTDYTGADPEVIGNADENFATRDFLTQPPVRTWIIRLNLGF